MKGIWLMLIAAAAVSGCGKKSASSTPATSQNTNVLAEAASASKPLEGIVDPAMTAALKSFVQEKGRLPQSLFELKNAKLDSIPRAPEGTMYAIDPATVEVKLVKQ